MLQAIITHYRLSEVRKLQYTTFLFDDVIYYVISFFFLLNVDTDRSNALSMSDYEQ